MARAVSVFAAAAAAFVALAPAQARDVEVGVDRAATIRLEADAAAVIIGNPLIADVVAHDPRVLILTGRNFGATNIIALDAAGNQIFSTQVIVIDDSSARMTVHRGGARFSYLCTSTCQRDPMAGDQKEDFDNELDSRIKAIEAARDAGEE